MKEKLRRGKQGKKFEDGEDLGAASGLSVRSILLSRAGKKGGTAGELKTLSEQKTL